MKIHLSFNLSIIFIQDYICQLLKIHVSFLSLSSLLSLIPNNQINHLTFDSFSFLIQSFLLPSFLILTLCNQTDPKYTLSRHQV